MPLGAFGGYGLGAFLSSPTLSARQGRAPLVSGYGELQLTLKLTPDGGTTTRYKVFDKQLFADQALYMNTTTPDSWIVEFRIPDEVEKIFANPASNNFFTILRNGLGLSSAILPSSTGTVNRISDRLLEVDLTPQVSGSQTVSTTTTLYNFFSTTSTSYFTTPSGDPLSVAIQPGDGLMVSDHYHAHNVLTGVSVNADSLGRYIQTVEGTPLVDIVAGEGYGNNDVIGRKYEVIARLPLALFNKYLFDISIGGFDDPNGETASVEMASSASTYLVTEYTGVSSDDQEFLDGLINSRFPLAGTRNGYAFTDNGDLTADITYEPGFAPATTLNRTTGMASVNSNGQIANPYGSDFNLQSGFCLSDPDTTWTIRNDDGEIIATFTNIAAKLDGSDPFNNYFKVSDTPGAGVYIAGDTSSGITQDFDVYVFDPDYQNSFRDIYVSADNAATEA